MQQQQNTDQQAFGWEQPRLKIYADIQLLCIG